MNIRNVMEPEAVSSRLCFCHFGIGTFLIELTDFAHLKKILFLNTVQIRLLYAGGKSLI